MTITTDTRCATGRTLRNSEPTIEQTEITHGPFHRDSHRIQRAHSKRGTRFQLIDRKTTGILLALSVQPSYRFRHIVVAPFLEHGSDVEEIQVEKQPTETFYRVVPKRQISRFEFESKRVGAELVPQRLFHLPKATFDQSANNTISYHGFPSFADFILFPLVRPNEFLDFIEARMRFLRDLSRHLSAALAALENKSADLRKLIEAWQIHVTELIPFMAPAMVADEFLLESQILPPSISKSIAMAKAPAPELYCSQQAFFEERVLHGTKSFDLVAPLTLDSVFIPRPPNTTPCDEFVCRADLSHVTDHIVTLYTQMLDENVYFWQTYSDIITLTLQRLADQCAVPIPQRNSMLNFSPSELIERYILPR